MSSSGFALQQNQVRKVAFATVPRSRGRRPDGAGAASRVAASSARAGRAQAGRIHQQSEFLVELGPIPGRTVGHVIGSRRDRHATRGGFPGDLESEDARRDCIPAGQGFDPPPAGASALGTESMVACKVGSRKVPLARQRSSAASTWGRRAVRAVAESAVTWSSELLVRRVSRVMACQQLSSEAGGMYHAVLSRLGLLQDTRRLHPAVSPDRHARGVGGRASAATCAESRS